MPNKAALHKAFFRDYKYNLKNLKKRNRAHKEAVVLVGTVFLRTKYYELLSKWSVLHPIWTLYYTALPALAIYIKSA